MSKIDEVREWLAGHQAPKLWDKDNTPDYMFEYYTRQGYVEGWEDAKKEQPIPSPAPSGANER